LTPEAIGQLAAQARDHGFLWRLSKGGHDSWLYGTLHVGKQDWVMPGPKVSAAVQGSDLLALELDVADPATLEKLGAIYRRGAGQVPQSLQGRFIAQLNRVCLPESAMNDTNPLLLLTTVEVLLGRERGLEVGYGVEFILSGYAHAAGKRVAALETPESQMRRWCPRTVLSVPRSLGIRCSSWSVRMHCRLWTKSRTSGREERWRSWIDTNNGVTAWRRRSSARK
jgi:uncharacterized protein YbaP (TraB family)